MPVGTGDVSNGMQASPPVLGRSGLGCGPALKHHYEAGSVGDNIRRVDPRALHAGVEFATLTVLDRLQGGQWAPAVLISGHGKPGVLATRKDLSHEYRRYLLAGSYHDRLIACGPLLSDDGYEWVGTAAMAELADRASAEALLAHDPYSRAGRYDTFGLGRTLGLGFRAGGSPAIRLRWPP
jgi:uncharacterized protein YciI